MKIYHYHPNTGDFVGVGIADLDPLDKKNYLIPAYSTAEAPPEITDGHYVSFVDGAWQLIANPTPVIEEPPPPKTSLEIDTEKYLRRANSKNLLMAEMAAMNVARIKNGTWTVAQLTALMQDEQIKALIAHMETLSFELAIGVIQGLTNPLITPKIKSAWTARLVAKL